MSSIKVGGSSVNTVPSGVSGIGNVSLDITGQTYLRDKLFVGNDASFNTIYSSVVPTTANMLCNKTYVDSVSGTSLLSSNNTFTGTNNFTSTNNFDTITINDTLPTSTKTITMGSDLVAYSLTQNTGRAPIVSNAWIPTRLNVPANNVYSSIDVSIPFAMNWLRLTNSGSSAGNLTITYNSFTYRILKNGVDRPLTTETYNEFGFTGGDTRVWGLPANIQGGSYGTVYFGYYVFTLPIDTFNATADTYDIEITMNANITYSVGTPTFDLRAVGKAQWSTASGSAGGFTSTRSWFMNGTVTSYPTYPSPFVDAYYASDTRMGIIANTNSLIRSKNDIEVSTGNNLYFKTTGSVDSNMNFNTTGLAEFSAGTNFNCLVGATTSFSQHDMDMFSVGTNTINGATNNIIGDTNINTTGLATTNIGIDTATSGNTVFRGQNINFIAYNSIQLEATNAYWTNVGQGNFYYRAYNGIPQIIMGNQTLGVDYFAITVESGGTSFTTYGGGSINFIAPNSYLTLTGASNIIIGAVTKQQITSSQITNNPTTSITNKINSVDKQTITSTTITNTIPTVNSGLTYPITTATAIGYYTSTTTATKMSSAQGNLASITVANAGCYLVEGNFIFTGATFQVEAYTTVSISTTSGTVDTTRQQTVYQGNVGGNYAQHITSIINLNAGGTIYFVGLAQISLPATPTQSNTMSVTRIA
jgi:hypothetical protein